MQATQREKEGEEEAIRYTANRGVYTLWGKPSIGCACIAFRSLDRGSPVSREFSGTTAASVRRGWAGAAVAAAAGRPAAGRHERDRGRCGRAGPVRRTKAPHYGGGGFW